jgi:hypothetical protein
MGQQYHLFHAPAMGFALFACFIALFRQISTKA